MDKSSLAPICNTWSDYAIHVNQLILSRRKAVRSHYAMLYVNCCSTVQGRYEKLLFYVSKPVNSRCLLKCLEHVTGLVLFRVFKGEKLQVPLEVVAENKAFWSLPFISFVNESYGGIENVVRWLDRPITLALLCFFIFCLLDKFTYF